MAGKSSTIDSANATSLKLLATSIGHEDRRETFRSVTDTHPPTAYFKSAQWSADGTCVVTNSADNHIRTFVIPPELLEERSEPLHLEPYSEIANHDPTDAVTLYPGFELQNTSTTLILSAVNEHPIRLHSALTSGLVASYPLINATTEAYIKPHCLAFTHDGGHFVAGSSNLISIFDLSRPGQEPILSSSTGPKCRSDTWSNPGASMRGIVSAFAIDRQHNILAAGTLSRHLGLYDASGTGECVGVFSVQDNDADSHIGGYGITQVAWSSCGRYLYIAERKSTGIMTYDIRNTGQLLGWLDGRCANTNQRLCFDLAMNVHGLHDDIWAGGTDGLVRIWHNPSSKEGPVIPEEEHHVHNDVVSTSVLHPSGSVLATASGQRHFHEPRDRDEQSRGKTGEASLKLWSVQGLNKVDDGV